MNNLMKLVKDFIEDESKKGPVTVTVTEERNGMTVPLTGLTFKDGRFVGLDGSVVTIEGYLNRLIKYCTRDIRIFVNSVLLTDIKPREILLLTYDPS